MLVNTLYHLFEGIMYLVILYKSVCLVLTELYYGNHFLGQQLLVPF